MIHIKKVKFLKKGLIAHRGFHDIKNAVPENSMLAFNKAIKYGYTIELDVRLTKDNKVVVFHDANLKRVCGINKKIEDITYEEILSYNLFNTNCKIPLFSDVLKLVDGKVGLLIETKESSKKRLLEKKLAEMLDDYNGLFAIQSFYPASLFWFKKHKKTYIIGLLASEFKERNNMSNLKKNICKSLVFDVFIKADFIAYDIESLPNSYVKTKRKRKLILGWTVKNKKEYDKAIKNCDNLICENMNEY